MAAKLELYKTTMDVSHQTTRLTTLSTRPDSILLASSLVANPSLALILAFGPLPVVAAPDAAGPAQLVHGARLARRLARPRPAAAQGGVQGNLARQDGQRAGPIQAPGRGGRHSRRGGDRDPVTARMEGRRMGGASSVEL